MIAINKRRLRLTTTIKGKVRNKEYKNITYKNSCYF